MKLKYREKINMKGEVHIPQDYQRELGLSPGDEVEVRSAKGQLYIKPLGKARKGMSLADPVDALAGSIPLPAELVDELVENEHMHEPQEAD